MTAHDKPVELDSVKCEVCLKEVPVSESTIPEASDYFVHFCGLECYEKWRMQGDKSKVQVQSPES